jgi:D-alanyl-D-alanine endopeptidase (penicillin-binding protein 7)
MKSTVVLFAAGAVFGVTATVFSFTHADTPVNPVHAAAPGLYIKAARLLEFGHPDRLNLQSQVALVLDEREGVTLFAREIDRPRPIASLTKLMTALVTLESDLPLDAPIAITTADRDYLKGTRSRLPIGAILTRDDLLRAALGASDNRAASALARSYPGGTPAFVAAMNARALALGMVNTHYADASGLDPHNVSTASDLARLLAALHVQARVQAYTTQGEMWVTNLADNRPIEFFNTNRLVRQENWEIALSKTGYTADAGNCLVMRTTIANRPVTVVLLNSWGKLSKYGDARRIRDWLLDAERRVLVTARSSI